ncbi:microtubule-associated protein 6 homolog [Brachionichthys hirsutus]|uniref:microtubule-associated protein 6 homolog n=1 Tax=Brachionichthys hirsutus TaxID=412623 RepID=UPI003604B5FC
MAWPCITRACCINRFWTELDKADIAVPFVFTKYSDVAHHPQPRQNGTGAITIETQPHPGDQEEAGKAPPAAGAAAAEDGSAASVMRQDFKAWRVRPERSCKPRDEYRRSDAPFISETQYQKDYKAWSIPRKHDHPWIPKPGAGASSSGTESGAEKSEIEEKTQEKEFKEATKKSATREKSAQRRAGGEPEAPDESAEQRRSRAAADALNRQIKEVTSTSSSYRTEFKAYKDVKPAKPIKAPSQYKPPGEETSRETSYSATFKGEQVKPHPTDNKVMERRRIRSLYGEPGKVDKPASRIKPKKTPTTTTTTGTMGKKSKEKQIAGSQSAKKKLSLVSAETKPGGVVTKKSKEISNRLAEAKQ